MELEVTQVGEVYVPEGAVVAEFVRYEQRDTSFGPRLRLWFKDKNGEFAVWCSPKVNERSNLGRILQGMGAQLNPGQKVNLDEFIGKKVGLLITKNNRGFAKLAGVFRSDETPF